MPGSDPAPDRHSLTYIVLAHKLPGQFARLVTRLHHPGDLVLAHIDAKSDQAPFEKALADAGMTGPGVELSTARVPVHWGGLGETQAALAAIRRALTVPTWSHVVLLSGQDYPIKPADEISGFLTGHPDTSFLFSSAGHDPWPADQREGNQTWYWDGDLRRLTLRYYRVGRYPVPLPGRWQWGIPRAARPPAGLRPRQGSAWWALHRPAAQWVLDFGDRHPEVGRFFSRVLIPAENYFQMLLDASPYRDALVQDDLHFQSWDRWHPRVLGQADLPALLASPKLFARKFDEDQDRAVLDELDRRHSRTPVLLLEPPRSVPATSARSARARRSPTRAGR
jgi:Core-2/I-Branching enzyme